MSSAINELRERLGRIDDLGTAGSVLGWDQQTMMPRRGAPRRADVLATVERIHHEMFIAADTGRLLEAAEAESNGADPDGDDARLLRKTRRNWEKARRVPNDLAADLAHAASLGQEAWTAARAASDFAAFMPYLERNLDLAGRYIACFDGFEGGFDSPYDVLLDDYEPGLTSSEVTRLFDELRARLVPIVAGFAGREIDDGPVHARVPVETQRQLVRQVVGWMGFEPSGWRLDDAVHPFETSFGPTDVRLTTRWEEDYFPAALFGAMHECGHGLYENGVAQHLARSPIGHPESLGMHESQSRMWENMVGRGRAFAEVLAPEIARTFDGSFTGLTPDRLFRAVNRVHPTFIRVEADEATYGLHIVLRFECERALIEGRLAVRDLPDTWNAKMQELLSLEVTDDANGVLQDVHWSAGLLGYFPTYALGNMIGGQLWRKVNEDIADLEAAIAAGELAPLREWLRENIHRHGSKFSTTELLQRTVGGPIEVTPFIDYLEEKLGRAYGIELPSPTHQETNQ